MIFRTLASGRYKPFWLLLLAIGFVLSVLSAVPHSASAQAGETVDVRIVPETAELVPGQTIEVAIEVVDVTDLYGFAFVLAFDPSVVQVVDVDSEIDGVQMGLGTFLEPGAAILNLANNPAGVIEFAFTQLSPSPPKSGTGNLIVITFMPVGDSGQSQLIYLDAQLAQAGGLGLQTNPVPGLIEVVSQSPSGPTATNIPIQPVGTTFPTATFPAFETPTEPASAATSTNTPAAQQLTPTPTSQSQESAPTATSEPATESNPPTDTPPAAISSPTSGSQAANPPAAPPTVAPEAAMTIQAAVTLGESVAESSEAGGQPVGVRPTTEAQVDSVGQSGADTEADGRLDGGAVDNGSAVPIVLGVSAVTIGLFALFFKFRR